MSDWRRMKENEIRVNDRKIKNKACLLLFRETKRSCVSLFPNESLEKKIKGELTSELNLVKLSRICEEIFSKIVNLDNYYNCEIDG